MPNKEHVLYFVLGATVISTIILAGGYYFIRKDIKRKVLRTYLYYLSICSVHFVLINAYTYSSAESQPPVLVSLFYLFSLLQLFFYLKFIRTALVTKSADRPRLYFYIKSIYLTLFLSFILTAGLRYANLIQPSYFYIVTAITNVILVPFFVQAYKLSRKWSREAMSLQYFLAGGFINLLFTYVSANLHSLSYEKYVLAGLVVFGVGKFIEFTIFSIAVSFSLREMIEEKSVSVKKMEAINNLSKIQIIQLQEQGDATNQENKRKIGRDLNEIVAHSFEQTGSSIKRLIHLASDLAIAGQLQDIAVQIASAYKQIKSKANEWNIGSAIQETRGFMDRIEYLVNTILPVREYDIDILVNELVVQRIDAGFKTSLLLILQESLINIIKHSNASRVSVILDQKDQMIILKISDNGKGFRYEEKAESVGLSSIQRRVQEMQGRLQVISGGRGTEIVVTFFSDVEAVTNQKMLN